MRNNRAIFLLCVAAAAHVFIFAAAFPFFSVVDEQMHMDLAADYSQGKIPRSFAQANAEAMPFLAIYSSPEFLQTNNTPPPWKQPIDSVGAKLAAKEVFYRDIFRNDESSQPPLYYSLAGIWWRLGKFFNLDGLSLLYWLRFINALLLALIVWLGAFAARKFFSDSEFIQIAVPALIASMPQTIFYAINNDILSPLAFGACFLLLIKFWETEIPNVPLAMAIGLALAATYLTKISNLPLLAASGIFIAIKIYWMAKEKKMHAAVPSILALAVCAAVPVSLWMAWCKIHFGDLTGSESKIQFLGWTHKPFTEWFQHPIFTPRGFWTFLSGNVETFWQGEMLWQRKPLALPVANWFYSIATIIFIGAALICLKCGKANPIQKTTLWFAFAGIIATLAFFGFLSIIYDFQDCFYPSSERPYFTSGRLMLGALIPFLLLFTFGLDCVMKGFSIAAKFFVLTALILFMLISEIVTDLPVFASQYNWYHQ